MRHFRAIVISSTLFLTSTIAYGQVIIPKSWKQFNGQPNPESEVARCAAQGSGARWHVRFDGRELTATPIKNLAPTPAIWRAYRAAHEFVTSADTPRGGGCGSSA